MGLLDGYFDAENWPNQGGLLARLIALQERQAPPASQDYSLAIAGRHSYSPTVQNATGVDVHLNPRLPMRFPTGIFA